MTKHEITDRYRITIGHGAVLVWHDLGNGYDFPAALVDGDGTVRGGR